MTEPVPLKLGTMALKLTPHYVPTIGARIFMLLENGTFNSITNLTPPDARALADYLKLAACQAEALEEKEQRKHPRAA
jgi:hypothetical protein